MANVVGRKWLMLIFWISFVTMVACQVDLSSEIYWKNRLPNTPMPKPLKDIVHPITMDVKIGREAINDVKGNPASTDDAGFSYYFPHNESKATLPKFDLYFLKNNLAPRTTTKQHLKKHTNQATFLPRHVAETMPFSSNKLQMILDQFRIEPNSPEADLMKKTLNLCEYPAIEGEKKHCATSLDSMVEFITSELGKNVNAFSTELQKEAPRQYYTIKKVTKVAKGNVMVCHKEKYAYAVFFCHTTSTAEAYQVLMVGADGTKANSVAVCHLDTSAWNAQNLAFRMVHVKPGTDPICHFLPGDHIVFTLN